MSIDRILLIVAVVCFLITAISAFSDNVNVNEIGFLALGLAAYAGSYLADGFSAGGRGRVLGGGRPTRRDGPLT